MSAHIQLALSHLGIYFDTMLKKVPLREGCVQLYCRDTAAAPCKYTISHHTHHHHSSPLAPPLPHTQSQTDKSVICNVVCVCAVQVGVIIIVTVHNYIIDYRYLQARTYSHARRVNVYCSEYLDSRSQQQPAAQLSFMTDLFRDPISIFLSR